MEYTEHTSGWPLLGLLQLLPFVSGLILIRLRGKPAFLLALVASVMEISLAAFLYRELEPNQSAGTMQFVEHVQLWGALHYHAAVDGMSVLFVLLTAILGFLCVFFILFRRQQGTSILAVMMGIQATLMSQFVTVDLLWFALMSVLEIFWVAYVTQRWPASDDPQPALARYLPFMLVSLLLLFLGVLILGWNHADNRAGHWSFSLYHLSKVPLDESLEPVVFFLLFYALGIRLPLFPFHGWLPDFLKFGNAAVAPIYLLGMKVGVYGMLRFVFPLTPNASWEWHKVAVGFAVTGVFYAALLALRQQNLRSLLAFAVVSHTGILTIGLFSLDPTAMQGSVLLALNFGLAISGLLFVTGLIWQRTHTTNLNRLGGMQDYMPLVGVAFLAAGLAIVGMPGTPGFNAAHFVLEGSIRTFGAPVTIAAAIGNLFAAGFLLRSFQRVFLSQPGMDTRYWNTEPSELTEMVLAGTIILITIVVGFYDAPWLNLIEQPVTGVAELFTELRAEAGIEVPHD